VQKPLCNYIGEVRELHQAAKKPKIVTQMGNQGRTMEGQRLAKEWIEQGRHRHPQGNPPLDQPPHLAPGTDRKEAR
jgi:predicted dehydrogenase